MRQQVLRALAPHNFAKIDHPAEATSALTRNSGLLPHIEK